MGWAWGYLAVSVVGTLFVVNAYRSSGWGPTSVGSFFAGWLTAEFPIQHIVWQAIATVAFAFLGAFGSWPGWVGLALTAVSWLGLLGLWRGGVGASAIVADLFGSSTQDVAVMQMDPTMWRGWRMVLPSPKPVRTVEVTKNIDYVGDGLAAHRLDVYRRRLDPPTSGAPVMVYIHGGGWVIGNKEQQGLPMLYELARRGWVCVTINYRLSPKATWPDHIVDCNRALAWVHEHIGEYGGDTGFIAVSGGSAGGHLCSLLALTDDPNFKPGFEEADTSVDACVSYYGVYDMTAGYQPGHRRRFGSYDDGMLRLLEATVFKTKIDKDQSLFEDASPVFRVHREAPPFLVLHGTNDTLVPVAVARRFVKALSAVSNQPVLYAEFPRTQHAFDVFPSPRSIRALQGVIRFLDDTRAAKSAAAVPAANAETLLS